MRLMDMVAQATHPILVRDELGRTFLSGAVVEAASAVRECPVRYILDAASSAQCRDLVREAHELFRPEDPLLRVPAEAFWLEWFNDSDEGGLAGRSEHRTGVMVEADSSGRRGRLRIFWPRNDAVETGWGSVLFDLDASMDVPSPSRARSRVLHRQLDHLNGLFGHAALELDSDWIAFMSAWTEEQRARCVQGLASFAWCSLPMVLAFSALLISGGALSERASDLHRLNKARAARKRPALLDHVEIGMVLGIASAGGTSSEVTDPRRSPRLHYVRGHQVKRSGKIYWRKSHFRGDPALPLLHRTISVRGTCSSNI
jgi:hypothetical protein